MSKGNNIQASKKVQQFISDMFNLLLEKEEELEGDKSNLIVALAETTSKATGKRYQLSMTLIGDETLMIQDGKGISVFEINSSVKGELRKKDGKREV